MADASSSKESVDLPNLEELRDFTFTPDWSTSPGSADRSPRSRDRRDDSPRRPRDRRERQGGADRRPRGDGRKGDPRGRRERGREPDHFRPVAPVHFYPEDEPFDLLVQSMRNTMRAYELFDLARIVLDKPDRFVVVVHPPEKSKSSSDEAVVFQSAPDGLPFLDRQEAVDHVLTHFIDQFAEVLEETVEPPKGTFPVVHRCGYTKKIIGPPNHHLYQRLLREHHASELPHLPFDKVRARMESCKDEESREEWLRAMTTVRRYRLRTADTAETPEAEGAAETGDDTPVEVEGNASADEATAPELATPESTPEPASVADSSPEATSEPEETVFESVDDLKRHLLESRPHDLVRALPFVRFSGRKIESLPKGPLRETIVRLWQEQQRFPLDTANHLRGKLRKVQFSVFKRRGGINFVCSVRRRRRPAGGAFTATAAKILAYLDEHRDVKAPQVMRELFGLGSLDIPETVRKTFAQDLRWLKSEGYVIEYADGRLEVQPIEEKAGEKKMPAKTPEQPKKEKKETKKKEEVPEPTNAELTDPAGSETGKAKEENPVDSTTDPDGATLGSERSPSGEDAKPLLVERADEGSENGGQKNSDQQ